MTDQYTLKVPVEDSQYRKSVEKMDKDLLIYHLRHETRVDGMKILHERAKQLRISQVSLNPAVNRVLLEYAGIKGLIETELPKLTLEELREAWNLETRPRVSDWIHKEMRKRKNQTTLGDLLGVSSE